jgi:hypothetical protein
MKAQETAQAHNPFPIGAPSRAAIPQERSATHHGRNDAIRRRFGVRLSLLLGYMLLCSCEILLIVV